MVFNNGAPLWLVHGAKVGIVLHDAISRVRKLYERHAPPYATPDSFYQVRTFFNDSNTNFLLFKEEEANKLVECCSVGCTVPISKAHPSFPFSTTKRDQSVTNFFKLVFAVLWMEKKLILPLTVRNAYHVEDLLDALSNECCVQSLMSIRSLRGRGSLVLGEKHVRNHEYKSNNWLRLLLSTHIHSAEDLTYEFCFKMCLSGGRRDVPLARFAVVEFLLLLCNSDPEKIALVERAKTAVEKLRKNPKKPLSSVTASGRVIDQILAYGEGADVSPEEMINTVVMPGTIKLVYSMEPGEQSPLYVMLPEVVTKFCEQVNAVFRSFTMSKRLQNDKNEVFALNLLLSYLTAYLPNFFIRRDASLKGYPKNFNEFSCVIYFTREYTFIDGYGNYEAAPPMSFLKFLSIYSRIHNYSPETHYQRVKTYDDFCDFVVRTQLSHENAEKFVNTFSTACYPKIQGRVSTAKRPIPRAYFKVFLDMLYSLEYLMIHLNEMASGVMPGVLEGRLHCPTLFELQEVAAWESIWGKSGKAFGLIDLSVLNYCPIFYQDGKVYRFEFIPRFYQLSRYELKGKGIVERVVPNHVRVTILMCETGLRQHHLIWLDKDRFDQAYDPTCGSLLAPLFVSSDKAHGEWTAIVNKHIFALLERQRDWYDQCISKEYQEPLPYGMSEGSRFGSYKPLFRAPNEAPTTWANYRFFPRYLAMLQYAIVNQFDNDSLPDLVYVKGKLKGDDRERLHYTDDLIKNIGLHRIGSVHTPHSLRAGFITEALRFLPPDLIGTHLTGQTAQLVWYYRVFDRDSIPDHQALLASYLTKNTQRLEAGEAPELAEAIHLINERLRTDIEKDPVKAIDTHRLISIVGVQEDKTGVELLRAKKETELAFNAGHICAFGNRCPKEIVVQYGLNRPCSICPYAMRGVVHLPAVSAEKDRCKEHMVAVVKKISHYKRLKKRPVSRGTIDRLEQEHDHYAREAFALEAIEQQLYKMASEGKNASYFAKDGATVVGHLRRVELSSAEHLVKRIVDVQNFPETSSPELDTKFAYLRAILQMHEGDLGSLMQIGEGLPGIQLASQISSMINSGALDVMDVYRIGQMADTPASPGRPNTFIQDSIGFKAREERGIGSEKGHLRRLSSSSEETES